MAKKQINPQYMEELVKYLKEYKSQRLVEEQSAKIVNKQAYADFEDWAKRSKKKFIPSYILFCRMSVTYIQWFKYRSMGVTHFIGYRLATEEETHARIAALLEAQKPKAIQQPAWIEEERARANRERMENLEKSRQVREAKNAKGDAENNY